MNHRTGFLVSAALLLAACGGKKNSAARGPSDTTSTARSGGMAAQALAEHLTRPSWMTVDSAAKTVSLDIEAGKTGDNNHWNFNGYLRGDATLTVPEGYKVTVHFKNDDPAMPHSFAVLSQVGDYPAMIQNPKPVFDGAMSSNATSPTGGTKPGQSETISFTASTPGQYAIVCVQPAHAAAGMWMHFNVSSNGMVGLSTS
ncbi:MAG TPA: sulfocyanin-like copper-binding protein [Gemmatimonadales bacterium]|nr:sulfocyanin-like copper-binding protein [Gemmatimonadales bacterium]